MKRTHPLSARTWRAATVAALLLLAGASPARLAFGQATDYPVEATGASVPANIAYEREYYVDDAATNGTGASASPFNRIQVAVDRAVVDKNAGRDVRINIAPGTYRERVLVPPAPAGNGDNAWLVIRRLGAGAAVISGSTTTVKNAGTAWNKNWVRVGAGSPIWRQAWPYRWGLADKGWYYGDGDGLQNEAPILRRKELIFVQGQRLKQVLTEGELQAEDGTFRVEVDVNGLANRDIRVNPFGSPDMNANATRVEVSERDVCLKISQRRNVIVDGLTLEHATDYQHITDAGSGLYLTNCKNFVVRNCVVRNNNNRGLRIVEDIGVPREPGNADGTLFGVDASDNGVQGMKINETRNLLAEECSTNRNNFRGRWVGIVNGAEPGGFKVFRTRVTTFLRHTSLDNWGRGMWWDTDNEDIIAESCYLRNNRLSGLFIEYNQGPALVRRCIIRDTQSQPSSEGNQFLGGLLISTSQDVTLASNILFNNEDWQLRIINTPVRDKAEDSASGDPLVLAPCRFTFRHNVFVMMQDAQIALAFPENATGPNSGYPYRNIYNTMASGSSVSGPGVPSAPNCFHHWTDRADLYGSTGEPVGSAPKIYPLQTRNLTGWRTYSGQEGDSFEAAPLFESAVNDDFRRKSGSPVLDWDLPTGPLD